MSKRYLAIDLWGWAEDTDFHTAIKKRERDSASNKKTFMNVFELEPEHEKYAINWFVPQIVGAKLVYQREVTENQEYTYKFPNYVLTEKDMRND